MSGGSWIGRGLLAGVAALGVACAEAPCGGPADCAVGWACLDGVCVPPAGQGPPGLPTHADPWGERWDHAALGPVRFADALAACEARGVRLPTATEVFRGRAHGPLPFFAPGEALWTLAPGAAPGTRVTVDPATGATRAVGDGERRAYRCVAPRRDAAPNQVFDPGFCHGPPTDACVAHDVWHADRWDRPALDLAGASFECAAVNAGLPTLREVQEVSQGSGWGLETGAALWSADVIATSDAVTVATWRSGASDPGWAWSDARGGQALATEPHPFRCVGRGQVAPPFEPIALHCLDGRCAQARRGRYRLVADPVSRGAALDWVSAQGICQYLGGWLPTVAEARQLFREGWAASFDEWLWTSDVSVGGPTNLRQAVRIRRGSAEAARWVPAADTIEVAPLVLGAAVRCVWTERRFERLVQCPPGAVQVAEGGHLACRPYAAATSCDATGCLGMGGELRDDWTNAWDALARPPVPFAEAAARCAALGARLPSVSELGRLAQDWIEDPAPLWTLAPAPTAGRRMVLGAGGADLSAGIAPETEAHPYRCIWAGPPAGTLGAASCRGHLLRPCHQYMQVRMDVLSRPAVPHAVAAWECAFIGGRLPSAREVMQASRPPEVADLRTWLVNPVVTADGTHGYAVVDGDGPWSWSSPDDRVLHPDEAWPFHCVTTGGPQ